MNGKEASLRAAFERIAATRMQGMGLANPALQVAAIGFTAQRDGRLGVLVTPWCINLVLLRDDGVAVDRDWQLPSGRYRAMRAEEPECGPFEFVPLLSPPAQFTDQGAAVQFAEAVMASLLSAPPGVTMSRRALFSPPAGA